MADSASSEEKTLEPSAKRLADARKEGQVPRSRDLAHLFVIGGSVAVLAAAAPSMWDAGLGLIDAGLRFDAAALADPPKMVERLRSSTGAALLSFGPALALMLLAAAAAPLAIGGWIFVPNLAAPRWDRLDPLAGIGRLASSQGLLELAKVLVVAVLLAVVGSLFVSGHIEQFAALTQTGLKPALAQLGSLLLHAFAVLAATLAAASAIDVPAQIFRHRTRLKMTFEEARREQKESEGDPQIKAKIRARARDIATKRMMAAVPKADVVITNPTHYAVALKYLEDRHGAPVVVAKGADAVAAKIRELARAHAVPQLSAPPLARALYAHVDIGSEIPAALYAAVAQVLAYVFQLQRFAAGTAERPTEPSEIEVPAGLDPIDRDPAAVDPAAEGAG